MTAVVTLPPRFDLSTVTTMAKAVAAAQGGPIRFDAVAITHLGALGAQLLLAAQAEWRAAGHDFQIAPRSDAFDAAVACLGLGDVLGGSGSVEGAA